MKSSKKRLLTSKRFYAPSYIMLLHRTRLVSISLVETFDMPFESNYISFEDL